MPIPAGYTSGQIVQAVPTGINSALVYITQATPSAVSSVSIDNCFTSTYDNYLITFTITAAVGVDSGLSMRLRASGTDSTTNYATQRLNAYSTTVLTSSNPLGTDEWYLAFVNATTANSYTASIQIFNPALASSSRHLTNIFSVENGGPNNIMLSSGYHTTASAYDGLTIIGANNFTGTIRVYGYANS